MSMLTALDDDLHSKFSTLEDQLIDAVVGGRSAMEAFVGRLSSLHKAASFAISNNSLSTRTLNLVRSVARTGSAVAGNVLQLQPFTDDLDTKRQADISDVFQRMTLNDPQEPTAQDVPKTSNPAAKDLKSSPRSPPLSKQASTPSSRSESPKDDAALSESSGLLLRWFIDNIHHPYPSPATKSSLSKDTGMPTPFITNYFVQMRRRVGWSSLVKKHFNSNKVNAIDCAHRVFLAADPQRPVDPLIVKEFFSVKRAAEQIYKETFMNTELVEEIEGLVKEVPQAPRRRSRGTERPTGVSTHNSGGKKRRSESSNNESRRKRPRRDSLDTLVSSPPSISSKEFDSERDDGTSVRNSKRDRYTPCSESSSSTLNSCPSSPDLPALSLYIPDRSSETTYNTSPLTPSSTKTSRKRRLSDSDDSETSTPKRLCSLPQRALPHVQPASLLSQSVSAAAAPDFAEFNQLSTGLDFVPNKVEISEQMLGGSELRASGDFDSTLTINSPDSVYSAISSSFPSDDNDSLSQAVSLSSDICLEEFCSLPAMPEFCFDFTNIPPPSIEPFPFEVFFSTPASFPSPPDMNGSPIFPEITPIFDDTDLHSLESLSPPEWTESAYDLSSTPDLVQYVLRMDKEAKLERLRQLKEEKKRLAEEQLELEQDLHLPQAGY